MGTKRWVEWRSMVFCRTDRASIRDGVVNERCCPPGRELRTLECNSAYDSEYLCDVTVFSLCISCLTSMKIEIIQEFKNSFNSKILLFRSTRCVKSTEKTHRIEKKFMPKRSEPLQKLA